MRGWTNVLFLKLSQWSQSVTHITDVKLLKMVVSPEGKAQKTTP